MEIECVTNVEKGKKKSLYFICLKNVKKNKRIQKYMKPNEFLKGLLMLKNKEKKFYLIIVIQSKSFNINWLHKWPCPFVLCDLKH